VPLLLLDLDNTVADRDAALRHWMAAILPGAPGDVGQARAFLVAQDADGFRPREEFLTAVRERFGLTATVDQLLADYRAVTLAGFPAISAGVRDRLDAMRRDGWKVAVVTNGESGVQEATVERIGLAALIDACVVSGAVGVRKPDPRIFELAGERCGESLDGAWMVGDGEVDVLGADRVGVRSVWLTRGRRWTRTDVSPTLIADTLDGALARIT
jgi:putative hydrolase of the HAD superfamily